MGGFIFCMQIPILILGIGDMLGIVLKAWWRYKDE